jgi:hypothetical protein
VTAEEYHAEMIARMDSITALAATFGMLALVCLGILVVRALGAR